VCMKKMVSMKHYPCLKNPRIFFLSLKYKLNIYKNHNYIIFNVKITTLICLNNTLNTLVNIFQRFSLKTETKRNISIRTSLVERGYVLESRKGKG